MLYGAYPQLSTATIGMHAFVCRAVAVAVERLACSILMNPGLGLGMAAIFAAGIGQMHHPSRARS